MKRSESDVLPAQHGAVLRVVHADGLVVRRDEQARAAAVEAAPAKGHASTATPAGGVRTCWLAAGQRRCAGAAAPFGCPKCERLRLRRSMQLCRREG